MICSARGCWSENKTNNGGNITGQVTEFPYLSEDEIFDADEIIAALRSEVGATPKLIAESAAV